MPFDAFQKFTDDVSRRYGEFDKNVMGGMLPGGAARADSGEFNPNPHSEPNARTQVTELTPLQRAPIGQQMTLGGVKGYKSADGSWKEGVPDAATIEASPQGMIPIPLPNSTDAYAYAGYAKSLLGELGRPFKITKPQAQIDFEEQTKSVPGKASDGTITFNRNTAQAAGNEKLYDKLGNDLGNKVLGRYKSYESNDGTDVAFDEYDTNRDVGYHLHGVLHGLTPKNEMGEQDPVSRLTSAAALLHRFRDDAGLTNPFPYGTAQVVGKPGEKIATGPSPELSFDTPAPAKSNSYQVMAGDTLTAIANQLGTSVQDLAKKNSIADVNNINVGMNLSY